MLSICHQHNTHPNGDQHWWHEYRNENKHIYYQPINSRWYTCDDTQWRRHNEHQWHLDNWWQHTHYITINYVTHINILNNNATTCTQRHYEQPTCQRGHPRWIHTWRDTYNNQYPSKCDHHHGYVSCERPHHQQHRCNKWPTLSQRQQQYQWKHNNKIIHMDTPYRSDNNTTTHNDNIMNAILTIPPYQYLWYHEQYNG